MAVGAFADVAPGPQPGTFLFQRTDGSNMLLAGPQAQALAQSIQQSKGPDQRLAFNDAGGAAGGTGHEDAGAGMSIQDARTPVVSTAPEPPRPPPPAAAMYRSGAPYALPPEVPPMLARPPEGPPAPGPRMIAGTKGGGVMYQDPNTGAIMVRSPGSAGVSQAQLQKRAGQGVVTPTSGSESVTGAFDRNPEYEEQLQNSALDRKLAAQNVADIQARQAQDEYQASLRERAVAAQQQRDAQLQQQEVAQRVATDRASLDKATADVRAAKVDPSRMFHGAAGTARLLGSAIAAGLGAFGAGMAHTPNFALDIINRAIDRDVNAQEQDLANKKEDRENALRQWTQSGLSLDQAKTAARISQLEFAKSDAASIAAKNKGPLVQANFQQLSAGIDEELSKALEQYRVQSLGKHTAEVASRYAYPVAPTGPTTRLATLGEQGDVLNQQKTGAEINKTNADADKARAAAGGKGGAIPRGYQQAYQAADSTVVTGQELLKDYGVGESDKVGYTSGLAKGAQTLTGDKARDIDARVGQFWAESHKMVTGQAPSEGETKEHLHQISSWSTAQKIKFIQNGIAMARHKQKFIEAQRGQGVNASEQGEDESPEALGVQEQ